MYSAEKYAFDNIWHIQTHIFARIVSQCIVYIPIRMGQAKSRSIAVGTFDTDTIVIWR